jgi:hypothetical protein
MASVQLTLSPPLCFLCSKFGYTDIDVLKVVFSEFYDTDVVTTAKELLLSDITTLELPTAVQIPPMPKRQGENKHKNVVDDVFKLFIFLDENKLLKSLPRYVTDNIDNVPSIRLLDGDLKFLVLRLAAFEKNLFDVYEKVSALAAMTARLETQNGQLTAKLSSLQPAMNPARPQVNVNSAADNVVVDQAHLNRDWPSLSAQLPRSGLIPANSDSWASRAENERQLRGSVSTSVDSDVDNENDWQVAGARRKRRKLQSGPPPSVPLPATSSPARVSLASAAAAAVSGHSIQSTSQSRITRTGVQNTRGRSVVVGTHRASVALEHSARPLVYAPPRRQRSVFCVDNVSCAVELADMTNFLSDVIGIEVVRLTDCKPRRRRFERSGDEVGRKAFRLVMFQDEVYRLLDPSLWPAGVRVCEWVFKPGTAPSGLTPAVNAASGMVNADVAVDRPSNAADKSPSLQSVVPSTCESNRLLHPSSSLVDSPSGDPAMDCHVSLSITMLTRLTLLSTFQR